MLNSSELVQRQIAAQELIEKEIEREKKPAECKCWLCCHLRGETEKKWREMWK